MKFSVVLCVILVVSLLAVCDGQRKKNKRNKKLKPAAVRRQLAQNVREIREIIEDAISSCLTDYDDIALSRDALESSTELLESIQGQTKKAKQCRNKRPVPAPTRPRDTDPCTQNLRLAFNESWDDVNGDLWYNISILSNSSVQECNPAHTWFDLRDITEGIENMTSGDYEHLLALCPPQPECVPHTTRSWTADDWPRNGAQGNVSLNTNYGGPCVNQSTYTLHMEVKSCPTSDNYDHEVYQLPFSCLSRDICRTPWNYGGRSGDTGATGPVRATGSSGATGSTGATVATGSSGGTPLGR